MARNRSHLPLGSVFLLTSARRQRRNDRGDDVIVMRGRRVGVGGEIISMTGALDDLISAEWDEVIKHLLLYGPPMRWQFIDDALADGTSKFLAKKHLIKFGPCSSQQIERDRRDAANDDRALSLMQSRLSEDEDARERFPLGGLQPGIVLITRQVELARKGKTQLCRGIRDAEIAVVSGN